MAIENIQTEELKQKNKKLKTGYKDLHYFKEFFFRECICY